MISTHGQAKANLNRLQRPEMRLPGWSADLEQGKENLANHYKALELRILNECAGLAKSGFADARISANAYAKFEEAFLLLRKALRIAAENDDPNDYGKKPDPNPIKPAEFTPRVDPVGDYNADGELKRLGPRGDQSFKMPPDPDDDG
jgi:hypothetical protein